MTVTPDTPQTIEGVTVSYPDLHEHCMVSIPLRSPYWLPTETVRAMGLTVPEPTVPCRIGDQPVDLTLAQVEELTRLVGGAVAAIGLGPLYRALLGAAARAHLDTDNEAGR